MVEDNIYEKKFNINNWNLEENKRDECQNQIITTKYTWYNFIPGVLFEQFQKISNFYFLISLTLNALIDSPVPFGLNVIPLIIVIIFSMIMRAFEDVKRYYADKEINDQRCLVLRNGKFVWCKFESLDIGDVIKCENNSPFPADVLLLFSSRDTNECSVTTVNLDGESNLKTFRGTISAIAEEAICARIAQGQMEVHCIAPSEDLHKFHGRIIDITTAAVDNFLSEKNLLLRGSCLKNTEFIIGCVVYAGLDTKLSLNSQSKKLKMSSVDHRLHRFILFYFGLQVLLSFICGLVWNILFFTEEWTSQHWYIPRMRIATWKRVEGFFAFYTLYNRLVPISIIFAVYFLKAFGNFFFNADLGMYDEESDQRARVNTIELLEELGQIEYLFCDKTGTLTENKMKFQRCAVDEIEYIDKDNELCSLVDRKLVRLGRPYDPQILDLFLCLCICHTVKVSRQDGTPSVNFTEGLDVSTLDFQASSPDELAFLNAMRHYGIAYVGNMKDKHWVSVLGVMQTFVVREVLEFDSIRKCMSVLVDFPDGSTQLICKGAECSLFDMADSSVKVNIFMKHLASFAEDGLRVLVVGKKVIDQLEAETFSRQLRYYRSSPTLIDRESEIYGTMENKLTLVGVTGVEDKLQEDVPQTIKALREAGIKVWIITGDKEETAINISLSAGHISKDMHIHHLTSVESENHCVERLNMLLNLIEFSPNRNQKYALVVDGKSFSLLIKPIMVSQFTQLCVLMHATLCCRMNPLQKAQAVKMVKDNVNPTPITAAIGDGGNDVSMILEAHVGIGIFGKEGRQAVRVADYAIVKFSFLRRAIIIHGQNLYINIAKLIDFYFYKSMMYVMPLFLYSIFCGFSMLNLYDTIPVVLYNITYNTLPPMIFALFDKSLPDRERLKRPHLYRDNQRNQLMSYKSLFKSFFLALIQSSAILLVVYLAFSSYGGLVDNRGSDHSYLYFGQIIFFSLWIVTLIKVVLISHTIVLASLGLFILNIIFCFAVQLIYQAFVSSLEYHLTLHTLSQPSSWLLVSVLVLLCSTIDLLLRLIADHRRYDTFEQRRISFEYSRTK